MGSYMGHMLTGQMPRRNHIREDLICVKFYLYSRKDRRLLHEAASRAGMTDSTYIRTEILKTAKRRLDKGELAKERR